MADPIIDVWSRKIETPHHGYWQGGYREDSHTKWCGLKGAWPFGQSYQEEIKSTNQSTKGQFLSKGLFKGFICTKNERKYFCISALK